MNLFTLFYIQTFLSGTIALLCFYKSSQRSFDSRLIGMLFVLSCAFNLLQLTIFKLSLPFEISNVVGSIYDILFLVMAGVLYDRATKSKYRTLLILLTVLFVVGAVSNLIFIQKTNIASWNKFFISLIVMAYCIVYFYRLMVDLPAVHLQRLPMFWVNSAFLIYTAGTVFAFAFTTYVIDHFLNGYSYLWGVNLALFILQQLLIIVGIGYEIQRTIIRKQLGSFS
jgi:hypothetical protein